jgi:hypothetical protein
VSDSAVLSIANEGPPCAMRRRSFIVLGLTALSRDLLYAAKFPEYPVKAAKEYPGAITIEGLTVGVRPTADPDEQHEYFGLNFSKNNFLPVLVVGAS